MSKRIVSLILALILLVGMVPAGVISASAASNRSVSANAIKFIKDWEGFVSKPYADGTNSDGTQRYSYGYGTAAPNAQATITEAQADEALREELKEIDTKVNNFAAAHNKNFTQSQHDALVSFSYNVGWGWMSQSNYRITKAVIGGATGNAFLQAMCLWSNVDSLPVDGLVARRMAEADMYLNGSYSKNARESFTYVKFDANGGVLGEDKVQAYDYNSPVTITSVPTREDYTFLGWYLTTGADASWIGVLNKDVAGKTLYARWQSNDVVVDGKVVGTPADYTISGQNFASTKVYAVPNANTASVGTVKASDTFKVTAEYIDNNKDKWLKINSGWVKLGEIKVVTGSGSSVTVTVTNDFINVRKEPNTDPTNAPIGSVNYGDQLVITEVKEVKGALWGKFERGWVALMYTNYDTASEEASSGDLGTVIATGTVMVTNTNLNVRTGAGTDQALVASLTNGTKVDIYDITSVNGHPWGRIGAGRWVCLDYVNYKRNTVTEVEDDIVAPTQEDLYKFTATVNQDGLNIYADPTDNLANPIGSLNKNDNVKIMDMVAVGTRVFGKIVSKNIIGWIQLEYTTYTAAGVVSHASDTKLNVRAEAGNTNGNAVTTLPNGAAVTILQMEGVNGKIWGRVKEGWIDLDYVKLNTTKPTISSAPTTITTPGSKVVMTGLVNSGINLNVRLGAGVNFEVVNSLTNGTAVKIYEKQVVGGHYWGKLGDNAWICLTYVTDTTGTTGLEDESQNTTNTTMEPEMATVVNCTTGVNIRSTPSVTGALLGSAPLNSRVKVLEMAVYNNSRWARTEEGWISSQYLLLDSEASFSNNSTVSVNGLFRATALVNTLPIYDSIGTTGTVLGNMLKGDSAYVTEIQSADGVVVSGKVTFNGKTGWIDLSDTTYTARGQVAVPNNGKLDICSDVNSSTTVGQLDNGSSVSLVDIKAYRATGSSKTTMWGKISAGKWVSLDYVNLVSTSVSTSSGSNTMIALGKIAYEDMVNVRTAAGTHNNVVTQLAKGTEVTIYEETVVNEAIWCRISTSSVNGWVAKDYIDVTYTVNTGVTTPEPEETEPPKVSNYITGIVNSNVPLKIRAQADVNSAEVGTLEKGLTVTIYEQKANGGMTWGRVDKGWISMSYVTLTSTGSTGAGDMGTVIKAFSKVNIRADATTNSAIVGDVMVNSRVEVLDQKVVNGYTWYRLNNGWIAGEYIELDAPFVGNNTNTSEPNAPITGADDEVGGMSTTAVLNHRLNDVVQFYNFDGTKLTANGTKLVNGETVVITELKGFGTDVWAKTKHGWFNLTDESTNFVAVGKVNTSDSNYLMVLGEAGKTSTQAVDKIRNKASITLTNVAVANNKLWGRTAKGWVDMTQIELTAVVEGAGNAQINEGRDITPIYQKPTSPIIKNAKAKPQHLSITVYNAINGYSVGIIRNDATFWIKEVKADGTTVWGSVQTSEGDYWVKLSDITYANIDTYATTECFATTSPGGSATMTPAFKIGDTVSVNNLTAVGGTIYAEITSNTNKGGWLKTSNLNAWSPILPEETAAPIANKLFEGTIDKYVYLYDAVNGTAVGTLQDYKATICIKEIRADGGIVWGMTRTDVNNETKDRWIKLTDLKYVVSTKYSVDGSAVTEAGSSIAMGTPFKMGQGVSVSNLTVSGNDIYAQIVSETNNGAWVKTIQLNKWASMPTAETAEPISGALFKAMNNGTIYLYDKVNGTAVGTLRTSTEVYVKELSTSGGVVWGKTQTSVNGETKDRWVKVSDLKDIDTQIAVTCYPVTAPGGTIQMATQFKIGENVKISVSSLTYSAGTYYAKITSTTNNGGWVKASQLTIWSPLPQTGTHQATSGAGVISTPTAKEYALYNTPSSAGTVVGRAYPNGSTVLVTEFTASEGSVWVKIHTENVSSDYQTSTGTAWMPYSSLNAFNAKATTNANELNVRNSTTTADNNNVLDQLNAGKDVDVTGLSLNGGDRIWANIEYKNASGATVTGFVDASYLTFWTKNC